MVSGVCGSLGGRVVSSVDWGRSPDGGCVSALPEVETFAMDQPMKPGTVTLPCAKVR